MTAEIYNISEFRTSGFAPFYCPSSTADICMEQAHALLTLFADAFRDSGSGQERAFDNSSTELKANALDGIAQLIAIARYSSQSTGI